MSAIFGQQILEEHHHILLQTKLFQCHFEPCQTYMVRLLCRNSFRLLVVLWKCLPKNIENPEQIILIFKVVNYRHSTHHVRNSYFSDNLELLLFFIASLFDIYFMLHGKVKVTFIQRWNFSIIIVVQIILKCMLTGSY